MFIKCDKPDTQFKAKLPMQLIQLNYYIRNCCVYNHLLGACIDSSLLKLSQTLNFINTDSTQSITFRPSSCGACWLSPNPC